MEVFLAAVVVADAEGGVGQYVVNADAGLKTGACRAGTSGQEGRATKGKAGLGLDLVGGEVVVGHQGGLRLQITLTQRQIAGQA